MGWCRRGGTGWSRWSPSEAGPPQIEGDDVEDAAAVVQELIGGEAGFALALDEVDDGVEDELDGSEEDGAGDDPDGTGVDEAVCTEEVDPEAAGLRFAAEETGEVGVAIFAEGDELGLEGEVAEGVPDDEGEEDEQRGGWISGHGLSGRQERGHGISGRSAGWWLPIPRC